MPPEFTQSKLLVEDPMIRERVRQVVLVLAGLVFLVGAYPLTQWNQPDLAMDQMLGSVYATLGLFMMLAVRNPSAHRSLIAFAAWSSVAHASVMAAQVALKLIPQGDLLLKVPPFAVIGILLLVLAPRKSRGAGLSEVETRMPAV